MDTTTPTEMAATRRPEYALWKALRQKCTNPKASGYARFGGRGVGLDPSWRGPDGFDTFVFPHGQSFRVPKGVKVVTKIPGA